ncbi:MAG TPA: DUF5684 domain-containing protein [Candidatus Dojkabacteria bacterium]|nr:DUF5684 domain-containing protein [Candidatus Dojkabacteria bacterium]
MKKLNKFLSILVAIALPMALFVKPVIAQDTLLEDSSITYEDFEFDDDWLRSFEEEYGSELSSDNSAAAGVLAGLFTGSMMVFTIILGLAQYIYFALALQKIAERLGMENTWFAWIPILQAILLFKMGDKNPYLLLLSLIPFVGALIVGIIAIIAMMNICEKRGRDKMLALIVLLPIGALILLGILAWGKDSKAVEKTK